MANRIKVKTKTPRAPHGPWEAGQAPPQDLPQTERLNLLLTTPIPDTGVVRDYAQPTAGGDGPQQL
eukprot:11314011-Alexandrium_andersonii.AAC.1